ncbi:MAG: DNA polymerase IV, partial [Chitinivibrionales bacterium]
MRLIVHIDMDAFFASVEVRDNPSYKGKPVIIGALPGHRGVVSTASYEARKHGIHSAMPVSEAYSKCPHGIFIKPDIAKYSKVSESIMEVLSAFSPKIEQVSIDEAYIDMSGSEKLFGSPMEIISAIRDAVCEKEEVSVSCGAAPNKLLAKIASDYEKPKGSTVTPMSEPETAEWLAPLPLRRLPGIGKKSSELLSKYGFYRVLDIQACSIKTLNSLFSENRAAELHALCMGYDTREVITPGMEKSISKERTYQRDEHRRLEWERTILYLSRLIARRARERKTQAMKVTLT